MRREPQNPPAVLLGGTANALSAARSLGAVGVQVTILGDGVADCLARRSRFCHRYVHFERSESLHDRWLDCLERHGSSVVLPCCDAGALFLARHRSAVAGFGHLPAEGNDEATLVMLDKQRTYDKAAELGIGAPRTFTATSLGDAERALETGLSLPCAVKPTSSDVLLRRAPHFHRPKGALFTNTDDLRTYVGALLAHDVGALVTEVIPGSDDRYCSYNTYLDGEGEPLVHFTKRKPRQYPPDFGLGTFHETVWLPTVAETGLRFFQGIGATGFANIEFKQDERDGELKVIECNPRFTMANGLAVRAGVDFAVLAYDRVVGNERAPIVSFREHLTLWFPPQDVRAFRAYRARGQLTTRAWLRTLARFPVFPTFSWRDPVPSLVGARSSLRRWWRRSRDRASTSPGPDGGDHRGPSHVDSSAPVP